jgi:hypothetical protein
MISAATVFILGVCFACAAHGGVPVQQACAPPKNNFTFCNVSLPLAERVDALLSALTVQEKVSLMGDLQQAVPRLNLPSYSWNTEGKLASHLGPSR